MHNYAIVRDIELANPSRSHACVQRRLIKVFEELGEASEAYLSRTCEDNYKGKTWDDYREESIDILIVLVDVALTTFPNNNYPPSSLLPIHIKDGLLSRAKSFPEMEKCKFEIARSVIAAQSRIKDRPDESRMGFYGAISTAVKHAARMVYAEIPGESDEGLPDRVYDVLTKKLDKWRSRMAVIEARQVLDAKTYFEDLRDRHEDR